MNGGYHVAYLVGAAFVLVGLALAATVLRVPAGTALEEEAGERPVLETV